MKDSDILYIVMPAYNEEENICDVIESWIGILDDKSDKSRLVVADSGSTDGTHDILIKLRQKYRKLEILEKTNQYHGPKVIALYQYAVKHRADYVFQTDSDGQTNPDEFNKFWDQRKKYDAILGLRSKRGDGKARAFVEKIVCLMLRMFFGVTVPDANAPFRLMKVSLLKRYINRLPTNYDLPNIILTAYFAKFCEKIKFEEISFKPRIAGVNSINLRKIFKIGKESLGSFWSFRRDMYKIDPVMCCNKRKDKIKTLFVIFGLLLLSIMIVVACPAFPWNTGESLTDSSVFKTVALQMRDFGAMPYLDTFDHKGPLLYLINYFSILIHETGGVFVFEALAIFFTLWFMYRIARLNVKSCIMCFTLALIAMTPFLLIYMIDWDNFTELYALPFIAGSLYVFLKYFMAGKVTGVQVFLTGFACACVAMLRINMVGVWVVFCMAIVIKCVKNKLLSDLRKYVLAFVLGGFVLIVPIIVWLIMGGAFQAFVDVYIGFNMSYANNGIQGSIKALLYFVNNPIIIVSLVLSFAGIFFEKKLNRRNIFSVYLLSYLLVMFTVCMSGFIYPHYGMILAPMTIFPLAALCGLFEKDKNNLAGYLAFIAFLVSLCYPAWLAIVDRSTNTIFNRDKEKEYSGIIEDVCANVESGTRPSDKIVVYGNWNYVYLKCGRMPASKYSYQFPIMNVDENIKTEFMNEISEKMPKAIVVQAGYYNDTIDRFINSNRYEEVWQESEDGAKVYILK